MKYVICPTGLDLPDDQKLVLLILSKAKDFMTLDGLRAEADALALEHGGVHAAVEALVQERRNERTSN